MDEQLTSPTFRSEKYTWLRNKVRLDLMDIDEEVMQMPFLIQEAGECSSLANESREKAKEALLEVTSTIANHLRTQTLGNGKERSESRIETEVPLYPDYREKVTALSNARLDAALWASLVESLRSKSMAIRVAADLLNSGFITPDFVRNKRRREIREAAPKVQSS